MFCIFFHIKQFSDKYILMIMFCIISVLDCQSYKHPIDNDDIEVAEEYICLKPEPTSPECKELAELLNAEAGINSPTNADEGLALYRHLKSAIL